MRKVLALAAAAASVLTGVSIPTFVSAQEWRDDPCRSERHDAGRTGTIAGDRTGGAVLGGAAGAVAGHQLGAHSVRCNAYPSGYRYHRGCRWVTDYYRGRDRSYEVCRDHDGYWRRFH